MSVSLPIYDQVDQEWAALHRATNPTPAPEPAGPTFRHTTRDGRVVEVAQDPTGAWHIIREVTP
jgi:hypothetical protein